MTHKNHTGSLGPEAFGGLQDTPLDASKDEALQRAIAAIRALPVEQLEAVLRKLGMENVPQVMSSLECIRKGDKVEALESAISENRDPTVEELDAAVREVGLENDSKMGRGLEEIRNCEKILKAAELMIEASSLLHVRCNSILDQSRLVS